MSISTQPGPTELTGAKFKTGSYYGPSVIGNGTRTPGIAQNWYIPWVVPVPLSIDRLSVEITAIGTAANVRMAIYADNGSAQPGALIVDGGNLAVAGTGALEATVNATLAPGLYWLAFNTPTATGAPTVRATNNQVILPQISGNAVTAVTQGNMTGYSTSVGGGDVGAFSATALLTGLGPTANVPLVAVRSQ